MTALSLFIFTLLYGFIDRLLFFITVIIGMQIPAWLNIYIEHLGRGSEQALIRLNSFRTIAKKSYGGDLQAMAQHFVQSNDVGVQEMGKQVMVAKQEWMDLQEIYNSIINADFIGQIQLFIQHFNFDLAKVAFDELNFSLIFSLETILCGFIPAFLVSIIYNWPKYRPDKKEL